MLDKPQVVATYGPIAGLDQLQPLSANYIYSIAALYILLSTSCVTPA